MYVYVLQFRILTVISKYELELYHYKFTHSTQEIQAGRIKLKVSANHLEPTVQPTKMKLLHLKFSCPPMLD